LQDYWQKRWAAYGSDQGFRNSSPSINIYREDLGALTSGVLTTAYTLKVEARNIPEINMSSPTFAHHRNPVNNGTGNVTIAIDFHYMTQAQVLAADGIYFPAGKSTSWDGWEYFLTYNATMDRAAADQILRLPSYSWSDKATLDAWWTANNLTVSRNWERNVYPAGVKGFLGAEGGYATTVGRLDLRACEDLYNYGQGVWGSAYKLRYIDADHVSLASYNVGYGFDALISRWLYWGGIGSGNNYPNGTPNGIVPFEPWYDNMSLRVNISDDHANVTMYGTVSYGFRAWTSDTAPAGTATFRWEVLRLDYVLTSAPAMSELNIYAPYRNESDPTSMLRDPGSCLFGAMWKYDWVPTVITLKPGESIFMQAPRELSVGYLPQKMIGDYADGSNYLGGYYDFLRVLEVFGNATIHPVGCYPGTYTLDKEMGDMTIVGPFVPIIIYRSDITWLVDESAPRIELWIQ